MSVKFKKKYPPNHDSHGVFSTKADATKAAKNLSSSKCGVIVFEYGRKPVKLQNGKKIRYAVMAPANQSACKKK